MYFLFLKLEWVKIGNILYNMFSSIWKVLKALEKQTFGSEKDIKLLTFPPNLYINKIKKSQFDFVQ